MLREMVPFFILFFYFYYNNKVIILVNYFIVPIKILKIVYSWYKILSFCFTGQKKKKLSVQICRCDSIGWQINPLIY